MNLTIIGASEAYAKSIGLWALESGHEVTFVGFSLDQSRQFIREIGGGNALGPNDDLPNEVIFLALPYDCLWPVLNNYPSQFNGKILVDLILPTPGTAKPIAGSVAEEIAQARPRARVVKAILARMRSSGGTPAAEGELVRLASDDAGALDRIAALFEADGLRVIRTGSLHAARELESLGRTWLETTLGGRR